MGFARRRQARAEVAGHPVGERAEADGLPLCGVADPLEAPGHALQPLGVGREVIGEIRRRSRAGSGPARSSPAGW